MRNSDPGKLIPITEAGEPNPRLKRVFPWCRKSGRQIALSRTNVRTVGHRWSRKIVLVECRFAMAEFAVCAQHLPAQIRFEQMQQALGHAVFVV